MTDHVRFVRRNRVDERIALGIAAAAGLVALFAGAEPTGTTSLDFGLVFIAVTAVSWASASAPWWASAGAAGIAASIALQPVMTVIGAVGFVVGLAIGLRRRDLSETRALVGGVAANVLIRSDLDGFLGLSAIVACTVGLVLIIVGLRRRPRRVRQAGWAMLGAAGAFTVIALGGVALAANSARPDVSTGAATARSGIDLLSEGDYQAAAALFDDAAQSFAAADDRIGGPLAMPSRMVPGVAQNVSAGSTLASAASSALERAASSLRAIDPDALRLRGGAIDLEAIAAVGEPLEVVSGALDELRAAIDEVRSPWLVGRLDEELSELESDLAAEEPRLDNAIEAVRLAPQMLGSEAPRRYLILFTSPSEARGLGGFPGNYAEVVIDEGRVTVAGFDRRSDLEEAVADNEVSCAACPTEFLARYGRFGFTTGLNDGVANRAWSNITMPAHFPYVAETAALLYPQSGGRSIDGVMAMDPYVIQQLMTYTGSVEVPELGATVEPGNSAKFILEDQYVLAGDDANADRIDALETLGQAVITRLLTGSLPEPPQLADDLAPLVAERRLLIWTQDPEEQEFLDRIGLLGSLPAIGDSGGFSISVTNAGASKIDVFLDRVVELSVVDDPNAGSTLRANVELTNDSPSSGLPRYVIGNSVGLPDGASRLYVSIYGPPTLQSFTVNGETIAVESHAEAGWSVYGAFIDLMAGETVTIDAVFEIVAEPSDASPVEFEQPLSARNGQ